MTTSDRYWFAAVGTGTVVFAAVDVWRDRCGDDSTFSCGVRRFVQFIPGGRYVLAAGLAAAGVGFFDHIAGPLTRAAADTLQEAHRG